jgi:hypothetical protein
MANFVLTEEQYNRLKEAGVMFEEAETKTVVDGGGSSSGIGSKVQQAAQTTNNPTIEVTNFGNNSEGNSASLYEEGTLITKKDLKERRLKKLRENSEIIPVKKLFGL